MNLIFSQLKTTISVKDVNLPELNTALTNFNLQITSTKEDDTEKVTPSSENSVKVSFDSEKITLSFSNIYIDGSGMIKDPDS
jgi:CMP-2-keto-3-deoxyoctulosonic acid synthetase